MTLSQNLIGSVEAHRDRLYAQALRAVSASSGAVELNPAALSTRAEHALEKAVREVFPVLEKDPRLNAVEEIEKRLPKAEQVIAPVEAAAASPMPADIWARIVATIQVEAAKSAHSTAINPDSVLLSPDPLLAPKKPLAADDIEGLDLASSSRFIVAGLVAILVGVGLTVYLLTRPIPAAGTHPASHPATTNHK